MQQDKTSKMTCAPSIDSDQLGHPQGWKIIKTVTRRTSQNVSNTNSEFDNQHRQWFKIFTGPAAWGTRSCERTSGFFEPCILPVLSES